MKKKIVLFASLLIILSTAGTAFSKPAQKSELANIIRLYKAGNYTQCYTTVDSFIKKDPSNALAYYYKAMSSAQIGKRDEAIENYEKAISLSNPASNLNRYATRGKNCLQNPDSCHDENVASPLDGYIKTKAGLFTEKVQGDYERLKIEQMMRDINSGKDIQNQEFKEYRDFSSMNNDSVPTNDEIVAAIRTLQKAGMSNMFSNQPLSMYNSNNENAMLNMLGDSTQNMNPQLIQALITNNMSQGF